MEKSVKTLIASAAVKCGTEAALARRIGVPAHHISEWKAGRRAISPESVVLLCDVLELPGEECQEWVAISLIENPKNASRAEVLKRALFACWVLGAASLLTLFFGALGTGRSAEAATRTRVTDPLGISQVCDVRKLHWRLFLLVLRFGRHRARVPQPVPGIKGASRGLAPMACGHP